MSDIPDELRKTARSLVFERERLGLSQKQVAARMGVSQSKVCRLEGSADADLVYGDVAAYAKALGLNVTLFYDEEILHSRFEQLDAHTNAGEARADNEHVDRDIRRVVRIA
jgi:transcriptional regulator with XRE-family HTH domain